VEPDDAAGVADDVIDASDALLVYGRWSTLGPSSGSVVDVVGCEGPCCIGCKRCVGECPWRWTRRLAAVAAVGVWGDAATTTTSESPVDADLRMLEDEALLALPEAADSDRLVTVGVVCCCCCCCCCWCCCC
jgi:hypothetical protein